MSGFNRSSRGSCPARRQRTQDAGTTLLRKGQVHGGNRDDAAVSAKASRHSAQLGANLHTKRYSYPDHFFGSPRSGPPERTAGNRRRSYQNVRCMSIRVNTLIWWKSASRSGHASRTVVHRIARRCTRPDQASGHPFVGVTPSATVSCLHGKLWPRVFLRGATPCEAQPTVYIRI